MSDDSTTSSEGVDPDEPQDSTTQAANDLYELFSISTDKLFFICYTPANTLRPRWHLVQAALSESSYSKETGIYFCSFY